MVGVVIDIVSSAINVSVERLLWRASLRSNVSPTPLLVSLQDIYLFINNLNSFSPQVNWKTRPKRVAHRRRSFAKTMIMNSSLNLLFATVVIGIFAIQRIRTGTVEEHRPKSFSPHFGCWSFYSASSRSLFVISTLGGTNWSNFGKSTPSDF